jgi:hypothetical protein
MTGLEPRPHPGSPPGDAPQPIQVRSLACPPPPSITPGCAVDLDADYEFKTALLVGVAAKLGAELGIAGAVTTGGSVEMAGGRDFLVLRQQLTLSGLVSFSEALAVGDDLFAGDFELGCRGTAETRLALPGGLGGDELSAAPDAALEQLRGAPATGARVSLTLDLKLQAAFGCSLTVRGYAQEVSRAVETAQGGELSGAMAQLSRGTSVDVDISGGFVFTGAVEALAASAAGPLAACSFFGDA